MLPYVNEWTLSLPVAYVPPAVRVSTVNLTFVMIPSIPGFVTCFLFVTCKYDKAAQEFNWWFAGQSERTWKKHSRTERICLQFVLCSLLFKLSIKWANLIFFKSFFFVLPNSVLFILTFFVLLVSLWNQCTYWKNNKNLLRVENCFDARYLKIHLQYYYI